MYLVATLGSKQSDSTAIVEPGVELQIEKPNDLNKKVEEEVIKDINNIYSSVITHTKIYSLPSKPK